MGANLGLPATQESKASLAERLERGELIHFPTCPFALPHGKDLPFLFSQRLRFANKNITFNPHTDKLHGYGWKNRAQAQRLLHIIREFGEKAAAWIHHLLPQYHNAIHRDRVSFRPEEEATRKLRTTARNDLIHIDAFPTRPTRGARLLRLFVNINPVDARVWITSELFSDLVAEFGNCIRVGSHPGNWELGRQVVKMFSSRKFPTAPFDLFMLRMHHYLKLNEKFQEKCRKQFWKFPPGSVWLAFTDSLSHAVLRGRFALEHSFFVPKECLLVPEVAPVTIFEQTCLGPCFKRAA